MVSIAIRWTWTISLVEAFLDTPKVFRTHKTLPYWLRLGLIAEWQVAVCVSRWFPSPSLATLPGYLFDTRPKRDQDRDHPDNKENKLSDSLNRGLPNTELVGACTDQKVGECKAKAGKIANCNANRYCPHFSHRYLCSSYVVFHILDRNFALIPFVFDRSFLVLNVRLESVPNEKANAQGGTAYKTVQGGRNYIDQRAAKRAHCKVFVSFQVVDPDCNVDRQKACDWV